ncbi:SHOCT domain-containing protein [Nocardioides sp. GCM10027113]|uniref:SHOCT domain-containing protein n=1 Tax=unclassified Nocardioides TaxID=2615069 RepID=UPI00360853DF
MTISGDSTGAVSVGRMTDNLPKKCARMNDEGQLPTCTQTNDGGWEVSYPGTPGDPGGAFAILFVLAFVAAIGGMIWKASTASRMAREAGMSERDAATMALLTDDGLEATYLASSLRRQDATATPPTPESAKATVSERLEELGRLRDQGLVTDDEYTASRRAILDSL